MQVIKEYFVESGDKKEAKWKIKMVYVDLQGLKGRSDTMDSLDTTTYR